MLERSCHMLLSLAACSLLVLLPVFLLDRSHARTLLPLGLGSSLAFPAPAWPICIPSPLHKPLVQCCPQGVTSDLGDQAAEIIPFFGVGSCSMPVSGTAATAYSRICLPAAQGWRAPAHVGLHPDLSACSCPGQNQDMFFVFLCTPKLEGSSPTWGASAELCAAVTAFLSLLEMGNTYFELGIWSYFRLLLPLLRKFGHMLLLSPKSPSVCWCQLTAVWHQEPPLWAPSLPWYCSPDLPTNSPMAVASAGWATSFLLLPIMQILAIVPSLLVFPQEVNFFLCHSSLWSQWQAPASP